MKLIASLLIFVGGLVALVNLMSLVQGSRTKRFRSPIPLVGAFLIGIGMFILPVTRHYCWLAPILDVGTLALLVAIPRLIREFWNTRRRNLVSEYRGRLGRKTACLQLFKGGVFIIRLEYARSPDECGLVNAGVNGKWQRDGGQLKLFTESNSAVFDVVASTPESVRQLTGFASWEGKKETSLAGIEFVKS